MLCLEERLYSFGTSTFEKTRSYLDRLQLFPINLTRYVNENSDLVGAAYLALQRQLANILSDND